MIQKGDRLRAKRDSLNPVTSPRCLASQPERTQAIHAREIKQINRLKKAFLNSKVGN